MKIDYKKIGTHLAVGVFLALVCLCYFHPLFEGKAIYQSDIAQYIGMSKERNDFRQQRESYWTNSAFAGMPTYQLGAEYPHNYIKKIDGIIRFLPRPADYLFLYFIGLYVLLLTLKVNWKYALLGALGFGFSTYLIIILGVGHNAKAHAIGYFPFVMSGIILSYNRKYLLGFVVTTLSLGLEIGANHYQMTYYLGFLVAIYALFELYKSVREKQIKHFAKSSGILLCSLSIALMLNATPLMATKQYSTHSTRGKSELNFTPDGAPKEKKDGLDKNYITEYSYGVAESLNLFIPRIFGGANNENVGKKSNTYDLLSPVIGTDQALYFSQNLPTYWAKQPIVAAPAYVGVVIFFLFVLSLVVLKDKNKYWLLSGALLSLMLSWGKNFPALTDTMIDYFPLYNKFRAVSSVQVILEMCIPTLAILGLYNFAGSERTKQLKNKLLLSGVGFLGFLLILLLSKSAFSFQGINDQYYTSAYGPEVMKAIVQDRKDMFSYDIYRAMFFVSACVAVLYLYTKGKIKEIYLVVSIGAMILFDQIGVDKRYVNEKNFVDKHLASTPFTITPQEEQILKDKTHFRVMNTGEGLNGARTSYFFKSIGGYHAAKPMYIQELFDYQLYGKGNMEILNMFNVKYLISENEDGLEVNQNKNACGNAWFVEKIQSERSWSDVMKKLDGFNPKKVAITTTQESEKDREFVVDSTSKITLTNYAPDKMEYEYTNNNTGFAVFSEMYYSQGWKAMVNEKEAKIHRVDYALRGLELPQGKGKIVFTFSPEVVEIGGKISLCGSLLFIIATAGWVGYEQIKRKKKDK